MSNDIFYLSRDQHVHLYGCLTAKDLWHIGRSSYKAYEKRLEWFENEYEKVFGFRPNTKNYWKKESFESLKKDFEFTQLGSFEQFQAKFNLIIALCPIKIDNFCIEERIFERLNTFNIEYFEARTVIPLHFSLNDINTYLMNLCLFIKKMNNKYTLSSKIVFSLPRENNLNLKQYSLIRSFINAHPKIGNEIIGIDFAFNELGFPPKTKVSFMQRLKEDNKKFIPLKSLYHVGENYRNMSVASAVRWVVSASFLGFDRLGHATVLGVCTASLFGKTVFEKKEEYIDHLLFLLSMKEEFKKYDYFVDEKEIKNKLNEAKINSIPFYKIHYNEEYLNNFVKFRKASVFLLKEKKITIECCPTSNMLIGGVTEIKKHPLRFFHENKINIVYGTDDPGVFNIDWKSESLLVKNILR